MYRFSGVTVLVRAE